MRLYGAAASACAATLFAWSVAPCAAEPASAPCIVRAADLVTPGHAGQAAAFEGMQPDRSAIGLSVASCGTVSCHGGPKAGNHDVQSFAYTIWMNDDPHARAYEVLHEPRSRRMARSLGLGEAHRAQQCLACHSMQNESRQALPPEILADGVGCGSCHGDSSRWQHVHYLPEWKRLSTAKRESLGYRDLSQIPSRVQNCIPCHVGDASREVNHDLIAAGHPRLAFEFAAYERLWPRHWAPSGKVESEPDFAERSWAVGQAATLEAVAKLLAVRAERAAADITAGRPHRWPELSEFDCYACHQALSPRSSTAGHASRFQNPFPGQPSWQPWSVSAGRLLEATAFPAASDRPGVGKAAVDMRRAFEADWSIADKERLDRVLLEARGLARAAQVSGQKISARERIVLDASHEKLDALLAATPPEWRFWDAAVQTLLLIEAADGGRRPGSRPGTATEETRRAIDDLRESLRFPAGVDSPRHFDPVRFNLERAAVPLVRDVQP